MCSFKSCSDESILLIWTIFVVYCFLFASRFDMITHDSKSNNVAKNLNVLFLQNSSSVKNNINQQMINKNNGMPGFALIETQFNSVNKTDTRTFAARHEDLIFKSPKTNPEKAAKIISMLEILAAKTLFGKEELEEEIIERHLIGTHTFLHSNKEHDGVEIGTKDGLVKDKVGKKIQKQVANTTVKEKIQSSMGDAVQHSTHKRIASLKKKHSKLMEGISIMHRAIIHKE